MKEKSIYPIQFVVVGLTLYFILITNWTIHDTVNYGIGLGALFFYYLTFFCSGFYSLVFLISFKSKQTQWVEKSVKVLTVIGVVVALWVTYSFTIGRGSESPWNGVIFNP